MNNIEYNIILGNKWGDKRKRKISSRSKFIIRNILKSLKKEKFTIKKSIIKKKSQKIDIFTGEKIVIVNRVFKIKGFKKEVL